MMQTKLRISDIQDIESYKLAVKRSRPGRIDHDAFEIKESPIAGKGLFTKTLIRAGDFIGIYKGEIVDCTDERAHRLKNTKEKFSFIVYDDELDDLIDQALYYIDASDPAKSSFMRMTNCPVTPTQQNAYFIQIEYDIVCVAVKDIQPGEEIVADYGPNRREFFKSKKKKNNTK
jgi:SET domain-containing protein